MRKIGLIIGFIILTLSAFGQQFLWSTVKDTTSKHVPLENVTKEVLNFYDYYEFYYDLTGFSKDVFLNSKSFKNSGISNDTWNSLKKKIYNVEDLTVFAFKTNEGRGSVILVMCISKDNVDMICFSNTYERDALWTIDREKFKNWVNTLLNLPKNNNTERKLDPGIAYRPEKGSGTSGGTGTGTGTGIGMGLGSGKGIGYGSGNRGYVNIPDVNINEIGVIYVEVHVTEQGDVINARILSTPKYPTSITNEKTQQEVLRRALAAKYKSGKEELRIIVFK
jgi:hypothetical protein